MKTSEKSSTTISATILIQKREHLPIFIREKKKQIVRKAALTDLLSTICEKTYFKTPVIVNEAVNKNHLTANSVNSRSKIVIGLLRSELEPNLGLAGAGQEVSILRSTLIRTGILDTKNGVPKVNLHPHDYLMANLLGEIEKFVREAREQKMSFAELYARLTTDKCYIGLRRGLVPIYVATVFHEYKKESSSTINSLKFR